MFESFVGYVTSNISCIFRWLLLWYLMPLSTTFQLYRGDQFYWCKETGVTGESLKPAASHWQTSSYNVVSSTTSPWTGFSLTTLWWEALIAQIVVNLNYHMITTTTAPYITWQFNWLWINWAQKMTLHFTNWINFYINYTVDSS